MIKRNLFLIMVLLTSNLAFSQVIPQIKETNIKITTTCEYCGKKFIQKKKIYKQIGIEIIFWGGGADHCDINYEKNHPNNGNFFGISNRKNKYCSRKCACEAGEE
jgi:hypothetical protein